MKKTLLILLVVVFAGLALSACQGKKPLSEADAAAFGEQIDGMVEETLVGLSEKDYSRHSQYFDEEMLDHVDEVSFPLVYDEVIGVLGAYQSRTLSAVFDQGRYRIAVYDAQFENDPAATVRIVFYQSNPEQITGLWFDSELLSGK